MLRHDRDVVSLMGGLLLALIGGLFLLDDLTAVRIDDRWVAPLVLLVVGGLGLLAGVRRVRAGGDAGPGAADPAPPT